MGRSVCGENLPRTDPLRSAAEAHVVGPPTIQTLRSRLVAALALVIPLVTLACVEDRVQDLSPIDWRITTSEGLDALLLIGVASGDPLQAEHYPEAIAWVEANVSPAGQDAMRELDRMIRDGEQGLTGPVLTLLFSAGPHETLADVIESARAPEERLRDRLAASPFWREASLWELVQSITPHAEVALEALRDAGFPPWYEERFGAELEQSVRRHRTELAGYDVIAEQARLLGRPLDQRIDVRVMYFSHPYGVRSLGQQFLAHHSYESGTTLTIAAHENFHPPFDLDDGDLWNRLRPLEEDPWMRAIVEESDPAYGYNTFEAVVNEGSAQALDQIVGERLGFADDPGERWRERDGGMHMLAAALYQAMVEDGFDRRGGYFEEWLLTAIDRGMLNPSEVRRRASMVVGEEAVGAWW